MVVQRKNMKGLISKEPVVAMGQQRSEIQELVLKPVDKGQI